MTPTQRSPLWMNLVLMAASLLVLWGLIELPAAAGVVDHRTVLASAAGAATSVKPWDNPRNLPDSSLLWIHRPGQHITGHAVGDLVNWLGIATNRRYPIDVTYDRWGFRNQRDLDSADVVLIGDSFLEWSIVAADSLVSSHLERDLGAPVMNLGQAAYGPQQELEVLRRFGLPRRPKVVIWYFFEGNDLLDVPRYERFRREWGGAPVGQAPFRERSFTANLAGAIGRARSAAGRDTDAEEARLRSCTVQAGGATHTLYFAYAGVPLSAADSLALQQVQRIVREARDLSAASGARFVLAFIPTKYRVYGDQCRFPDDGYGRTWKPNDLPATLSAWADSAGVTYLDLTPALRAAATPAAPLLYFADDGHWSGDGHAVAARASGSLLRQQGWLAGPDPAAGAQRVPHDRPPE